MKQHKQDGQKLVKTSESIREPIKKHKKTNENNFLRFSSAFLRKNKNKTEENPTKSNKNKKT